MAIRQEHSLRKTKPVGVFSMAFPSLSPPQHGALFHSSKAEKILPDFPRSPKNLEQIHFAPCISGQIQVEMLGIVATGLPNIAKLGL